MSRATKSSKNRAQTRLTPEEDPEFQIAPMIDILLVLLVFFMSITSTEVLQVNDEVRLPVAKDGKDPSNVKEGQVIINVIWSMLGSSSGGSGTFDIDGKRFSQASELTPILESKVATTPDVRVLIRADKEVRYDFLKALLRTVGAAKVSNVTFSVVDKEGGATAAATL
jgi:biopolymer transport protein ExbD